MTKFYCGEFYHNACDCLGRALAHIAKLEAEVEYHKKDAAFYKIENESNINESCETEAKLEAALKAADYWVMCDGGYMHRGTCPASASQKNICTCAVGHARESYIKLRNQVNQ